MLRSLVGSEMCIRDSAYTLLLREDGGCPDRLQAAAQLLGMDLTGQGLSDSGSRLPQVTLHVDGAERNPASPSAPAWMSPLPILHKDPPPRPASFESISQETPTSQCHRAVLGGQCELVVRALKNGLDPDAVVREKPLLIHATERGHKQIIQELLAARANPNCRGPEGLTPLQVAIECDRPELAAVLIQEGTVDAGTEYRPWS
eukprot:TRINITY_DN1931_c0_g1_i2.p1 TRINITY_DN1931_c0_g1~~TRINITY_DN1931_c0_g1_i2.p1  ORF type:complete len:203 (-),score=32.15 TRINITY_DN1931_c0_g1_i2:272-880(-)